MRGGDKWRITKPGYASLSTLNCNPWRRTTTTTAAAAAVASAARGTLDSRRPRTSWRQRDCEPGVRESSRTTSFACLASSASYLARAPETAANHVTSRLESGRGEEDDAARARRWTTPRTEFNTPRRPYVEEERERERYGESTTMLTPTTMTMTSSSPSLFAMFPSAVFLPVEGRSPPPPPPFFSIFSRSSSSRYANRGAIARRDRFVIKFLSSWKLSRTRI